MGEEHHALCALDQAKVPFELDRTGRAWGFNYSLNAIDRDFVTRSGFLPRSGIVNAETASASRVSGTRALIGVVSLWSPFIDEIYFERWFQWPTAFFSAFVPTLLAACAFALCRCATSPTCRRTTRAGTTAE